MDQALAARLKPIFRRYGVLRAIVFGSWARGDASRHSDLDLLVVQATEKRWLDRYTGILRDITAAVGTGVDLLIYTPEELEAIKERPLIKTALREGKVIYESGQKPPRS